MLPLKLTISAFCSYQNETIIDFTKLGKEGLYLITGNTGAGKTSIFDAILFALYGELNGDNRVVKMLRCTDSDSKTKTFVNLEFSYANEIYEIKRQPKLEIPLDTIDTTTDTDEDNSTDNPKNLFKQSASLLLKLPNKDGEPQSALTKVADVKKKIIEILGVDAEQFSQIAMIAQGDFLKLLTEKTEKRREIYRTIFNTEKYKLLQEKIKAEHNEIEKKGKAINSLITDKINELTKSLDETQKIDEHDILDQKITVIQGYIENDKAKKIDYENLREKYNNELNTISTELGKLTTLQKASTDLQKTELDKQKFSEDLVEFNETLEHEQNKEPERTSLQELINKLENNMEKYADLQSQKNNLKKEETTLKFNEQSTIDDKKLLKENNELLETTQTKIESLKNVELELQTAQTQLNDLEKQNNDFNDIFIQINDFKAIDTATSQQKLENLLQVKTNKTNEYDTAYNLYISEQAGIIAQTLKDGEPCTVCGSTTHPNKATVTTNAPTKDELATLKKASETAVANVDKQLSEVQKIKNKYDNAKENILAKGQEILKDNTISTIEFDTFEKKLKDEANKLSTSYGSKATEVNTLNNNKNTYTDLNKQIKPLNETIGTLTNNIASYDRKIESCKKAIELYKENIKKIGELEYDSKEKAETALETNKNSLKTLNNALKNAEDSVTNKINHLASLNGAIESLNKQLEPVKDMNITEELNKKTQEKNNITDNNTKTSNILETLVLKISNVEKLLKEIIENKSAYEANEIEYTNIANLNKTANGKVGLETYVQMAFFDKIIDKANQRLIEMSANEFKLVRQKTPINQISNTGLDFDIIEIQKNKIRNVKSLSGGESFMASLSLALGLSDEIQSSAGGIQLNSLFIDEGFGTLDDESLNKAIHVLNSLSQKGKIIGIISHVNQLKETMEKKIVVTKTHNNSIVEIIS